MARLKFCPQKKEQEGRVGRRKILNTEYYIIILKIKKITEEEDVHDAHDDLPGLPEGDPVKAPAHVAQQQHQHARDPRLLQEPLHHRKPSYYRSNF
jgi:hypothetical protein